MERYADGEVYRTFILATNDLNEGLPVYMGENSSGHIQPAGEPPQPRPDGWTRERYLKTYLMEMVRCMKERADRGLPLLGRSWTTCSRRGSACTRTTSNATGSWTRTGSGSCPADLR